MSFLKEYQSYNKSNSKAVSNLLEMNKEHDLMDMFMTLGAWFGGSYMRIDDKRAQTKQLADTFKVFSDYYITKAPSKLYRCTLIKDKSSDNALKRITTFQAGNKVIQSWTKKEEIAVHFYKTVHEPTSRGKQKGWAWVILEAHSADLEILFSRDSVFQFFSDLVNCYDELKEEGVKLLQKGLVSQGSKSIGTKFIINQQEIVCYSKKKIPAKIVDIMWSRESSE